MLTLACCTLQKISECTGELKNRRAHTLCLQVYDRRMVYIIGVYNAYFSSICWAEKTTNKLYSLAQVREQHEDEVHPSSG